MYGLGNVIENAVDFARTGVEVRWGWSEDEVRLQVIAADIGTPVEALTAVQIVQWFEKDAKLKREQGVNASVLKWDAEDLG